MTKALSFVQISIPRFSTVSLLHFDADFSDSIEPSRVWTAAGNAQISAADSKFGAASLLCDGTGDWITTSDEDSFTLGSKDFTVQCWLKPAADGVAYSFAGQCDAAGANNVNSAWFFQRNSSNQAVFSVTQNTSQITIAGGSVLSGSWSHLAASRIGNTLYLWVNASLVSSSAITGSINNSTAHLGIGSMGDLTTNPLNGRVDEFRMDVGKARFFPSTGLAIEAFTGLQTFTFAIDARYLPVDLNFSSSDYIIPSIKEITIDPAIISLGEDIGTRATVTVTFRDHKHVFGTLDFNNGTFWGKFRARYGLKLRGRPLSILTGKLSDAFADMEVRNFIIESTDGPSASGEFKIIAKDVLKLADGDRAQAPVLSNGFLNANITNIATTLTLSPTGIGAEYPASGLVNIGGTEICSFTRAADVLTITRAQKNTAASAHNAQDRVQLVLQYTAQDAATIIYDLLVTYAGVPSSYITLANWTAETTAFLSTVYTATIAEPLSVAHLVSELVEQVGLVIWWDDIGQQVRLQVLRPIASDAFVFDADNCLAGSLAVKEQPEKQLTQVYTYFAKLNPLVEESQLNNYRSTSFVQDATAEAVYGTQVIKKIYSRWIPDGGRAVADTLGSVLLARFADPPRRISFDVLRGSVDAPVLGVGYQVGGYPFQNINGGFVTVPGQITRLNPRADTFEVEVEEISATSFALGGGSSPGEHFIIIDANINNVNMRTLHDSLYGVPVSGNVVYCTINSGIIVGSASTGTRAFDVGTWPAGVTVRLIVLGRIQGHGGNAGQGGSTVTGTAPVGSAGGPALYTRQTIILSNSSGQIWGGGGGGGGGGSFGNVSGTPLTGGAGGGGGAGKNPGAGGALGSGVNAGSSGNAGTTSGGGTGGPAFNGNPAVGGTGGGPGVAGSAGGTASGSSNAGGAGGAAGRSIDGISFVTFDGSSPQGDIRGPQAN